MGPLQFEIVMHRCAFVIRTDQVLEAMGGVITFLSQRKMILDSCQLQTAGSSEGIIILHCRVEHHRVRPTWRLLEKIKGVDSVELLESKGQH